MQLTLMNAARVWQPAKESPSRRRKNILRVMKLTAFILLVSALHVSAGSMSQTITFSGSNVPLKTVFLEIEHQTGYVLFYSKRIFTMSKPVTIECRNMPLADFLRLALKNQPLDFKMADRTIMLSDKTSRREDIPSPADPIAENTFRAITGSVFSDSSQPLSGINITIKNTSIAAVTDSDGHFRINAETGQTLVFSSVEYVSQEIKVDARDHFTIILVRKVTALDQTVVVAYNNVLQRKNVSAVSVVKGNQIKTLPNASFDRSLQGQVAGLLVNSGNGQPGGGTSNMLLRGIATAFNGTARMPLFIIDGIPIVQDMTQRNIPSGATSVSNPMAQFSMNDVESYTVLKDAAAIALYGSKASNGVILITTKKGKAGKTIVNFRHQSDLSSLITSREPRVLNQSDYLTLLRESYKAANPAVWTDAAITADINTKFPRYVASPGDTSYYAQADWNSAINRDHALTTSTELSISGGNEKTVFYMNLSYLDQKGIVKASGFKRASLRYNFSHKPARGIQVGMNSTLSYNQQLTPSNDEFSSSLHGFKYIATPLYPIVLSDGSYYLPALTSSYYNLGNPAANLSWNVNRNNAYRGIINIFGEVALFDKLTFRTDFGSDFMLSQDKSKTDLRLPAAGAYGLGEVSAYDRVRTRLITTNVLKYANSFAAKHNFHLLLGQEAQQFNTNVTSATSRGFSSPNFEEVSAGSNVVYGAFGTSGNSAKETQTSWFSQLNYDYASKYLFSGSIRRDGSSKFGSNNRFGNYWSLGGGWLISDETFIQSSKNWLDLLKLRGSIGTAGNSASLTATTRYYLLSLGGNYDNAIAAMLAQTPGNTNIKWEKQLSKDIGIEMKLFNFRLGIDVDVYHRKASDLIYLVNLPGSSGYSFGYDNIGNIINKGIEVSVHADIVRNVGFKWKVDANWSTNKNKLVAAYQDSRIVGNLIQKVGEPFNSFNLVRWAGVNAETGKPQWLDADGKITGTYSLSNRVIAGQIQPKGFGGLTNNFGWRRWQLSAFLYYQYGHMIYNSANEQLLSDGSLPYFNQLEEALDRWQKPGDIASNPRRILNNPDGGNRASTRYLSKGDFIRLKNLTLSYDFPSLAAWNRRISNLRCYIQGNNLGLWTKFKGIDPENVNNDGASAIPYPQVKSFSAGIDIIF